MKQVSSRLARASAVLTLLLAALLACPAAAAGVPHERAPPVWLLQLDAGPGAAIAERQALADAAERDRDSPGDGDAAAPAAPRGDAPASARARPPHPYSAAAPRAARHAFRARAPPAS